MPGSITLPDDQEVTLPLIFKDAIGSIHAPASGGVVASDNEAVATVTLSDTDDSITVVAVSDGTANISYTNGSVSDTLAVTVAVPTPTSVAIDTSNPVFAPKP